MKTNALAVANYFIKLAKEEGREIHLIGLVKRVYLAHGFSLAVHFRGLLDPRFDVVEAWKYGPVIPSVYHSFKQYKNAPITDMVSNLQYDEAKDEVDWVTPILTDKDDILIVKSVWARYKNFTDSDMIKLTHQKGTPWSLCYVEGKNNRIPDDITGGFYYLIYKKIKNNGN